MSMDVTSVGIDLERKFDDFAPDIDHHSFTDLFWRFLGKAQAYKETLGDVNLFGMAKVNWREIPCIVGLAYAVSNFVISFIFTVSTPTSVSLLLALSSSAGIYYIRDSLNLRSLAFQIQQLKEINAKLEEIRVKYEHQGQTVQASLNDLLILEGRLAQINRLLNEREDEYRALNEEHRQLYEKYLSLYRDLANSLFFSPSSSPISEPGNLEPKVEK